MKRDYFPFILIFAAMVIAVILIVVLSQKNIQKGRVTNLIESPLPKAKQGPHVAPEPDNKPIRLTPISSATPNKVKQP